MNTDKINGVILEGAEFLCEPTGMSNIKSSKFDTSTQNARKRMRKPKYVIQTDIKLTPNHKLGFRSSKLP